MFEKFAEEGFEVRESLQKKDVARIGKESLQIKKERDAITISPGRGWGIC